MRPAKTKTLHKVCNFSSSYRALHLRSGVSLSLVGELQCCVVRTFCSPTRLTSPANSSPVNSPSVKPKLLVTSANLRCARVAAPRWQRHLTRVFHHPRPHPLSQPVTMAWQASNTPFTLRKGTLSRKTHFFPLKTNKSLRLLTL